MIAALVVSLVIVSATASTFIVLWQRAVGRAADAVADRDLLIAELRFRGEPHAALVIARRNALEAVAA